MVGTPIKNMLIANIAAAGGEEALFDRIAAGETMGKMAETLGVSRPFLSARLNRTPALKQALAEALKHRAGRWAEQTVEIADDLKENAERSEIDRAKVRIDTRKWLAAVEDPDKYGPKGTAVNVSIGGLHLEALRQVQSEPIEGTAIDVTPPEESPDA